MTAPREVEIKTFAPQSLELMQEQEQEQEREQEQEQETGDKDDQRLIKNKNKGTNTILLAYSCLLWYLSSSTSYFILSFSSSISPLPPETKKKQKNHILYSWLLSYLQILNRTSPKDISIRSYSCNSQFTSLDNVRWSCLAYSTLVGLGVITNCDLRWISA